MPPHRYLKAEKVRQFDVDYEPFAAAHGQYKCSVILDLWKDSLHIYDCEGQLSRTLAPQFGVCDITSFQNKFYVTEHSTDNGCVFVYNCQLELTNTVKVGYRGAGFVAVTGQFMFVTSYSENTVYRVEMPGGRRQQALITQGLKLPQGVASNERRVAVCCEEEHIVYVYDTEGRLQYKHGGQGAGPGQLYFPCGVAIDHDNRLFICDYKNNRVCIVSGHGQHNRDIDLGNLFPRGVVVTSPGQLMITCSTGCQKPGVVTLYQY